MIPKWIAEAVNRRKTGNAMAIRQAMQWPKDRQCNSQKDRKCNSQKDRKCNGQKTKMTKEQTMSKT
jgi:hypothetical protein